MNNILRWVRQRLCDHRWRYVFAWDKGGPGRECARCGRRQRAVTRYPLESRHWQDTRPCDLP